MKIHNIESANYKKGFGTNDGIQTASAFVNLDDSQLQDLAYNVSYNKKIEKKHNRALLAAFLTMPALATIAEGVFTESEKLSPKIKAAGVTAAGWVGILAICGIFDAVKRAASSKSDTLKSFNQDHPVLSFLTDLGLIIGATSAGIFGLNKLKSKHPEKFDGMNNKVDEFLGKIDNTKLNTEFFPKLKNWALEFEEKHPHLSNAGKWTLASPFLVGFTVLVATAIGNYNSDVKRINRNYKKLKTKQLETAQQLTSVLNAKNAALEKNQQVIIKKVEQTNSAEPEKGASTSPSREVVIIREVVVPPKSKEESSQEAV